jgi:hypothetical protein
MSTKYTSVVTKNSSKTERRRIRAGNSGKKAKSSAEV